MDCKNIQEKLSAYLEGVTSSEEKLAIDEHLRSCKKCGEYLADLRKTLDYMKNIEDVEPPQWLTQKVMAKVKSEAEPKKGIFQKLFYPLHIKLPIEAVAVIFIAVTTIYIFKIVQPEVRLQNRTEIAKAPVEEVITEKGVSQGDKTGGKDLIPSSPLIKEKKKAFETGPSLARSDREILFLEEKDNITAIEERKLAAGKKVEKPKAEEISEIEAEKSLKKAKVHAPVAKQEESRLIGASTRDELKTEVLSRAPKEKASADMKAEKIRLTLYVKNVESAENEIKNNVFQLGGKITGKESLDGKQVITAECDSKKINELLEKLRMVGEVKEEGIASKALEGVVKINIEIISILTQPK
jgi:hypothetical protein